MAKFFLSQTLLDRCIADERAVLEADELSVPGVDSRLALIPAVHFVASDGGNDAEGLVGTVKSTEQLAEMGAEHYDDAVLFNEAAYTVQPGFIAQPDSTTPEILTSWVSGLEGIAAA